VLRELEPERDAAFILELLNTPKFIQYIGDRQVRTEWDAAEFIRNRYAASYRDNGYGLYAVDLRFDGTSVGMCGFVRRDTLPGPDIGFSFLPEHERRGYGYESASAILDHGRRTLGFSDVYAITTLDNEASGRLLEKLGFSYDRNIETENEILRLFTLVL
jgi:RimJ/RimL family protein N-acetyltransferase